MKSADCSKNYFSNTYITDEIVEAVNYQDNIEQSWLWSELYQAREHPSCLSLGTMAWFSL